MTWTQETQDSQAVPKENSCVTCHGDSELWDEERRHLFVTEKHLVNDIHWQKGLLCFDCHGGNPSTMDFRGAHSADAGYHAIESPADIPEFCGRCHSDIDFMRRFRPSARTDQLAEYWSSGHGKMLKATGDTKVATCVSCHSHHNIRAVDDLESPVYPTRLADTCSKCHSDPERMAGREYNGRPLGHDQYERWRNSVHGVALLKKGDLGAPTCNNCHGNHGALPPEVGSVANACGRCHGKIAGLFAQTLMKHQFEKSGLPGCATCHSNHDIRTPSDEMLGMEGGAVCSRCHEKGQFGATLAGAESARSMRTGLEELKSRIASADERLHEAERLGMEVRGPRFELRKAFNALTNSRSLIHTFSLEPLKGAVDEGIKLATQVEGSADDLLQEHKARRVWLAASLMPILLVVGLLLIYIRSLPVPQSYT